MLSVETLATLNRFLMSDVAAAAEPPLFNVMLHLNFRGKHADYRYFLVDPSKREDEHSVAVTLHPDKLVFTVNSRTYTCNVAESLERFTGSNHWYVLQVYKDNNQICVNIESVVHNQKYLFQCSCAEGGNTGNVVKDAYNRLVSIDSQNPSPAVTTSGRCSHTTTEGCPP